MDKKLIYDNPLSKEADVKDFILEGQANITFENGYMRMESALPKEQGQKANFVYWCNENFPDNIVIEWDFRPLTEPGLAILFLCAKGINGKDLFDKSLQKRTGEYPLYHHGDINAFHISYFRRKEADERAFHTCNLRKSYGFYLVSQGADPMPDAEECLEDYHMRVIKKGKELSFFINDLKIFEFFDDGTTYGNILTDGKIGFRQLAPMAALYKDLKVYSI